jgi:hypothetical protein
MKENGSGDAAGQVMAAGACVGAGEREETERPAGETEKEELADRGKMDTRYGHAVSSS